MDKRRCGRSLLPGPEWSGRGTNDRRTAVALWEGIEAVNAISTSDEVAMTFDAFRIAGMIVALDELNEILAEAVQQVQSR